MNIEAKKKRLPHSDPKGFKTQKTQYLQIATL